jgi:chromosome segregation ATPase
LEIAEERLGRKEKDIYKNNNMAKKKITKKPDIKVTEDNSVEIVFDNGKTEVISSPTVDNTVAKDGKNTETESIAKLSEEINSLKNRIEVLREENNSINNNYLKLSKLKEEADSALQDRDEKISNLISENKELRNKIDNMVSLDKLKKSFIGRILIKFI